MKAFIIAEHADAALELCAGARSFADEVVLVAIDMEAPAACADEVLKIALPASAAYDDAYETLIPAIDGDVVFAEPTKRVKSIAGRLASAKGTAVVTDVASFDGTTASSMYCGGIGVRRKAATGFAVYTTNGKVLGGGEAFGSNHVVELPWKAPATALKVIASEPIEKSGVDLTKATVVFGVGRGFTEEGQLAWAEELCAKIGAELGCTRPIAEGAGWLPKETYIGVSGLMLAPKVYVAAGISGQMQHMVGVNRAGTIFAINKDKNAPIFKQCDYGLIGELKDVLPALNAAL